MIDPYEPPPPSPADSAATHPARAPVATARPDRPAVEPTAPAPPRPTVHRALARCAWVCVGAMVLLIVCMLPWDDARIPLFVANTVLAVLLLVFAVAAGVAKVIYRRKGGVSTDWVGGWSVIWVFAAPFLWVLNVLALFQGMGGGAFMGGAWGRPLRIRGLQRHPNLRLGADWTAGERPDPTGLDAPTRAALEALWLHDAQKEHASVPAFTRVSWLLAAVGAPADLLLWCHRAAMEEIDHTQRCFALAAGYAGRSFTVEDMPDLLLSPIAGGRHAQTDPLVALAVESLSDGCQLEDFNADVAARCAAVCTEPATRGVLERIAREERTHADFSWAVLEWTLLRDRARVVPPIEKALAALDRYPRPTAVSGETAALVARADVAALRRHGRLSDAEWAQAWTERLAVTRARTAALLARQPAPPSTARAGLQAA